MEPLLVVISSSEQDISFREGLARQLHPLVSQGLITVWHAGHVRAGEPFQEVTLEKVRKAHIIVPLVSADYLFAEQHELGTAMVRSAEARILPVLLRACTFPGMPLKQMKLLPEGGRPVNQWSLIDDAWASVARSIRQAVDDIREGKSHRVSVNPVNTVPMGPASLHGPLSAGAPAISSARPSIISIPPAVPGSVRGPVPPSSGPAHGMPSSTGVPPLAAAASEREPRPSTRQPVPRGRRSPLGAVLLLLLGAVLAIGLWKGAAFLAEPSLPSDSLPAVTHPAQASQGATVATANPGDKPACCAGVDCPDGERNAVGSYCEQFPTYCTKCPSGRRRVEGACTDRLSSTNGYHLRVGQALAGGKPVPASADICFRQSGTLDPFTCATANEARAGKAPATRSPVTVGTLTGGPGLDFQVTQGGLILSSGTGALSKGGGILTSALCVGIVVHASGPPGNSITVFLDP